MSAGTSTFDAGSPTTLIGGEWVDLPTSLDVLDPSNGSQVGSVGYGGAAEASTAADAAASAFPSWSATTGRERADALLRASTLLQDDAEEIGELLCRETGKRRAEAEAEVRFGAAYFRWFAERARGPLGETLSPETHERRQRTSRHPVGVAVCLTPWNFPVSIQARKVAAALAAGCTVVSRASERAPLAVVEMFRRLHQAGLPAGVVNLVHGPAAEVTETLLDHAAVRAVSFTGSTGVGRHIMALASRRIVRPALELGGDAPFVVFDDADLDAAVTGAMLAKFRNNGQSCIAANRFLVHDRVHKEFVSRLTERIDAMVLGAPADSPDVDLGPLIANDRVEAVTTVVEQAERAGARRTTHDFPLPAGGSYAAPALLVDVPDGTALACDEVFGPVAGVFRFDSEDEALRCANDTEMGLAAYVYTRDIGRVERMADGLEAGIVGVNSALTSAAYAPMGGVKQSGLGREGGAAGIEEFQDTRYVTIDY